MSNFTAGQRVATHPATDAWMTGIRYGTVTKVGRKWVTVENWSGYKARLLPSDIIPLDGGTL